MLKHSFYLLMLTGLLNLSFSLPAMFENGGAIRGTLRDKSTMEAIPYANVILLNKKELQVGVATTNMDGEFTFKNLAPGKYNVKGIYVGYRPQIMKDIVVEDQKTAFISIGLDNGEGVKLDETEVIIYSVPVLIDPDTKGGAHKSNCE